MYSYQQISLSDAAVKKNGGDERDPADSKKAKSNAEIANDYGNDQKRNLSIDAEDEKIETRKEEAKEMSPKRQAPVRGKPVPKQKPTPKQAPTSKIVTARQEELDDATDDQFERGSDVKKKPISPNQKDLANSVGPPDVLQQLTLQMRNLSSSLENLQSLLRDKMLKVFGSVSNSEPAVTNNNKTLAPAAPTLNGFAGKTLFQTYSVLNLFIGGKD